MLVPQRALNDRHPDADQCARGEERKRWRIVEAELGDSLERVIEAYREPLENVTAF